MEEEHCCKSQSTLEDEIWKPQYFIPEVDGGEPTVLDAHWEFDCEAGTIVWHQQMRGTFEDPHVDLRKFPFDVEDFHVNDR